MSVSVDLSIFRAYDIRGVVGAQLTEVVYELLGRTAGTWYRARNLRRIVVARDARLTSPAFAAALIAGLRASGCDVIDIGMVPTPVMYFAVSTLGVDGGAVVTASHNPPEFNGLKLRRFESQFGGEPLSGADIAELAAIAAAGDFADGAGTLTQHDIADAYVADVATRLPLSRPARIVLDGGNGVAGPIGRRVFEALGCEVIPLFLEPDGTFPNHHPDPLKEKNMVDLMRVVLAEKADFGIGLDGDGDRLGVIDGAGEFILPDRSLIVLSRDVLARGPAPIVYDVKCSMQLAEAIASFGGTPVMWKTGYTNGSAKMRELGAPLAGELSGHIFAAHTFHHYDDGTFAGGMLLGALERAGQSLSAALAPYPPLPSAPEDRLHVDDTTKFAMIAHLRAQLAPHYPIIDIDGVRIDFGDGWGLVRASNTEPAITTRFEARTHARVAEIRTLMLDTLNAYRPA